MVCCISNEEKRETEWIRGATRQQTKHMYCTQTAPKDSCSSLSEAFHETVAEERKNCAERWNDRLAATTHTTLCGVVLKIKPGAVKKTFYTSPEFRSRI